MLKLVIGDKHLSSWSMRPWLLLRQFDVPFAEIKLPLDTPAFYERIGQYSPTARVPVLVTDSRAVWDSLAICEYVNELLGGNAWPADRDQRAHARAISAEMHSGFAALRSEWIFKAGVSLRVGLSTTGQQDLRRVEQIWTECRTQYARQGDWLFGRFSIADAMYAPVALRCVTYGAQLSSVAQSYVEQICWNSHVAAWISEARSEIVAAEASA